LRRALKGTPEFTYGDEAEKLSIETSNPRWLLDRWISQFGFDAAKEIARINNTPAPVYVRVTKRFNESPRDVQEAVIAVLQESEIRNLEISLPGDCYQLRKGNAKLRQFADLGLIYFQDAASIMVADLVSTGPGRRLLDLCASPGSKTSRIFAAQGANNSIIVSGDIYGPRVKVLKSNLTNQLIENPNIVQFDAEKQLPFRHEGFDEILVDAPCSGTGTIRRNPEIRYFLGESDFDKLSRKQLNLLRNASKLIKPGGRIVYSTCSLESEENEHVIEKFLSTNDHFRPAEIDLDPRFLTQRGFARTFPQRDNMDGFFVAVLVRKA
ncbi:MAG: RsmB/NOP family class I SAM-dependent RNA methyltransferase, partial [Acidobacteria bacterium]|nr:RsmB/NOP family class I SAM-dependent RNA methyltransferase [Acidobacteriota bacterium]